MCIHINSEHIFGMSNLQWILVMFVSGGYKNHFICLPGFFIYFFFLKPFGESVLKLHCIYLKTVLVACFGCFNH